MSTKPVAPIIERGSRHDRMFASLVKSIRNLESKIWWRRWLEGAHVDPAARTVVHVEVQPYDPRLGIGTWWSDGSRLRVEVWEREGTVVISGNPAGLESLARHLLTLASVEVPDGRHFDFDQGIDPFTEDSLGLRLEGEKP